MLIRTADQKMIIRPAQISDNGVLFALAKSFATSFTVDHAVFESPLKELLETPNAFLSIGTDEDRVIGGVWGFTGKKTLDAQV